jgi:hypothetical protein
MSDFYLAKMIIDMSHIVEGLSVEMALMTTVVEGG